MATPIKVINWVTGMPVPFDTALLTTLTADNSATSLQFTSAIVSTFTNYLLMFSDIVPATNGVDFSLQVSTNNGTSYLTSSYSSVGSIINVGGGGPSSGTLTTGIILNGATNHVNNSASYGLNGWAYVYNPLGGTTRTVFTGETSYLNNNASPGLEGVRFMGYQDSANTAINAIRLICSSGNIVSGTAKLYGMT